MIRGCRAVTFPNLRFVDAMVSGLREERRVSGSDRAGVRLDGVRGLAGADPSPSR